MPEVLRVVVAESGGALARGLRDAGVEVVYAGDGSTPEQLARTAVHEDADAIGVAAGDVERLAELLAADDAADVIVFAAGAEAPDELVERLRKSVSRA